MTTRKRRPRASQARQRTTAKPVVFTSLEGALLDPVTFDARAARGVLERLAASDIPVIPISAMTLAELEPIVRDLGLRHAMIIEAGGAIARWRNGTWDVEPCGTDSEVLLDVLSAIETRSGADLMVYSVLPDDEAARLSGRSGAMLEGSTHRHFSEPFIIERGDLAEVSKAASALGFEVCRGPRFLHLCRAGAEGEAFARIRAELGCDFAIGIGASPLDASFLSRSDMAVIIPGPDGQPDPELLAAVPDAQIASAPGANGWAEAIEEALPASPAATITPW